MKPSKVKASWDPGQDNSLVSRDIYDHARASMYVCTYEGEWLWWSPARTRVKKKSKVGGCIWTKRVHGRDTRWDMGGRASTLCDWAIIVLCAFNVVLSLSLLMYLF